jgi:hypothetical protein
LLALASTIRPTSVAAIYALLAAPGPRRLMMAYILVGLAFTIAFGVLVVEVLHGISLHTGTDVTKGVTEIVGGAVLLAFAVLVWRGRVAGRKADNADDAPDVPRRWTAFLEHNLTLGKSALAGPATHIPGLFYLVALNVVTTHHVDAFAAVAEIGLYNIIWFALPLASLAVCIVRPAAAQDLVGAVTHVATTHAHQILLGVALVGGASLVVRGALTV